MEIKRSGLAGSFTGAVRIDPLFEAAVPARVLAASVTFEPGARTAWHSHPLGQTLIVTVGRGWAQRWGGPAEEARPGDVIWTLTHIAIVEKLDGRAVDWMEKVTDEQYQAP